MAKNQIDPNQLNKDLDSLMKMEKVRRIRKAKNYFAPTKSCPWCDSPGMLIVHGCMSSKYTGNDVRHFHVQCANPSCFVSPRTPLQVSAEEAILKWDHRYNSPVPNCREISRVDFVDQNLPSDE